MSPYRKKVAVVAVVASVFLGPVALAGCYDWDGGKPCLDGEYLVRVIDGPGDRCIPDGSQPPSGYETYPPGQTPTAARDIGKSQSAS